MRHIGNLMTSTRAGRAKREGCQSADAVRSDRRLPGIRVRLQGRGRLRSEPEAGPVRCHPDSNTDRFSTPSLVTRLGADVMNIQNAFMMILRMVPRAASSKCSPNSATCRSPNGRSPSSRTGPQTSTAAMQRLATYRHTPSSASDSRACDAFSKRMPWMPTSLAPTMFLAVSSKNTQRSAVRPKRVRASS